MHRFVRLLCLSAMAAILSMGSTLAEVYTIDRGHSTVAFSIRHLVSRTTGKFTQFQGTINYDPAAPEKSTVEATIQAASIDTENQRRDDHLRGADFFEVETYPEITFKSTSAKKQGEQILVTGDLTMHGVTKSVDMPVTVLGLGKHPRRGTPIAGFETELIVKCSDFGVNSYENFASVLGDEVKVTITIEAGKPRERRGQRGQGRSN